jgi:outer membrane receptor protein involved in Fe transport
VVCYSSTLAPAIAAKNPGCVPMNPFGPNALSAEAYKYWTGDTYFITTNTLDDVSGSISGNIFDLWAGPVKGAISGEMRWISYGVFSNATPNDLIDCTGLRLCNSSTSLWQGNIVNTSPRTSESVWEIAAELSVPLLKDLPLVRELNTNLAGRFTDYSTSGSVQTWKIGINWQVNDDIRFRGTNSIDIRAPTLDDLFSPAQLSHASYSDILTNTASSTITSSQGNPNLVPEVARTYTGGVVVTPTFLPGVTISLDYYDIVLKNALGGIGGSSTTTQNLCIASNGVSPYCALYVRPIAWGQPGYNTAANYPSMVLSQSLNTAYNEIAGWDLEVDYSFDMASIVDSWSGLVTLRNMVNDQPVQSSQSYPGAVINHATGSKASVTSFIGYTLGSWKFNLQNRWIAGGPKNSLPTLVYADPRVPSRNYDDLTITKTMTFGTQSVAAYLSISNIFDVQPPVYPTNNSSPGLYFPSPGAYDAIGRAFTIGMRANL